MVTECVRGDHRPLAVSREGVPTVLCREHVRLTEALEQHDLSGESDVLDHLDGTVLRTYLSSFSHGVGVGVG